MSWTEVAVSRTSRRDFRGVFASLKLIATIWPVGYSAGDD